MKKIVGRITFERDMDECHSCKRNPLKFKNKLKRFKSYFSFDNSPSECTFCIADKIMTDIKNNNPKQKTRIL